MGKPIKEARGEVKKCVWVCRFYAENAQQFLRDQTIKTENTQSLVAYNPLGIVLSIMPWNFPYWQVFRFAAPALMAGNAILLKHAPNVPQCAEAITDLIQQAFPTAVFSNLYVNHLKIQGIIEDPRVRAVTFTGGDAAGAKVAATAGRSIKKTVLELGGSDPFIVLSDANLKEAAKAAVQSRFLNAGQSCIAAKRLIVVKSVADHFIDLLDATISQLKVGDPLEEETEVGPLARRDLLMNLDKQVQKSVQMGAKTLLGGRAVRNSRGNFYEPTLMINVQKGMPAFEEELFGPVAVVIIAEDEKEAIQLANDTAYGLGASIWTLDANKGMRLAREIQAGCVFINSMVYSDPRLPFGGIKKSGYGRELSEAGIREFVNVKTVVRK